MITLPAIPEAPHTARELLKHYPVIEMAKAFREGTAAIGHHLRQVKEQSQAMRAAFRAGQEGEENLYDSSFDIDLHYHSERHYRRDDDDKPCPFYDAMKRE